MSWRSYLALGDGELWTVVDGMVILSALSLFLAWSAMLAGVLIWLWGKFEKLDKSIQAHVPVSDYSKAHEILMMRVTYLERWALRLNGTVKVNFA